MSQPRDPQPRTVLEGVDFNDLWNEREALKADLAAARVRLVAVEGEVEAWRSETWKQQCKYQERMDEYGPFSCAGCCWRDLKAIRLRIAALTGAPAADAPQDQGKIK